MADKATLATVIENQKKISARISLLERTVNEMFKLYCKMLAGEDLPYSVKKLIEEWESADLEGEPGDVVVKPPQKKSGGKVNYLKKLVLC